VKRVIGAESVADAGRGETTHRETIHIERNTTMIRRIAAALLTLGVLAAVSGCNTIAGLGKDLERGGAVVQDAAKNVQKKL